MRMATNQYRNENKNIIPFPLSSMVLMLMTAVVHIGLSGWENGQDEDEGNVLKHSGCRSPGFKFSATSIFSYFCIEVQLVLICMILSSG